MDNIGLPIWQIDPFTFEDWGERSDRWVDTIYSLKGKK